MIHVPSICIDCRVSVDGAKRTLFSSLELELAPISKSGSLLDKQLYKSESKSGIRNSQFGLCQRDYEMGSTAKDQLIPFGRVHYEKHSIRRIFKLNYSQM